MSEIKIVVDGKETIEIAPETFNLKSGDTLIIKIKSGTCTYEFLGNLHKLFAKKFPYNQIIIIPTNVDFEEYPKKVDLDSCIEYVKNVIKDETKSYLEIYEHIYKILNDYKKITDLNDEIPTYPDNMSTKGALIVKNKVDNSKRVIFIKHPSVSFDTSIYGDSEVTMKGYNRLKDTIFLNT